VTKHWGGNRNFEAAIGTMKSLRSFNKLLWCLAAVLLSVPSVLADQPVRLRVLSYNMHHGEGVDGQLDLKRIAGVIRSVKPDLVALQEVDKNARRTGVVDQPAVLAELTGMNVAFGGNIKLQGGRYGNAVLSRFPITAVQNHRLPNVAAGEQRGVLGAEVQVPGLRQPLVFYATHFDHRRDEAERVQSAEAVNALVTGNRQPALLLGDLNDVAGSETLDRLDKVWKRSLDQSLPTVPVGEPRRQIDFILMRPAACWEIIKTQVLEEAVASDHRAIFAVLQWRQP
jgi:endonuclease/exonuclease/phosphatase family metal-dependent hydrolase